MKSDVEKLKKVLTRTFYEHNSVSDFMSCHQIAHIS